jgi:hypothetical protein
MLNLHRYSQADLYDGRKIPGILRLSVPLLGLMLAAAGCAKVADPQPPQTLIPKPASDLNAIQFSDQIALMVSPPSFNTNGSPVTTLREIEIFRLARNEQVDNQPVPEEEFLRQAEKLITVPSAQLNEYLSGQILVFHDSLTFPDRLTIYTQAFRYAVRFINKKNQTAGLSNQALVAPVPIPPPPTDLKARVAEQFIGLTWTPPLTNMDDSSPPRIAGYNVYRSEDPEHFPSEPLNPSLLLKPEFEDRGFQFDRKYSYAISVVGSRGHPYAESSPSGPLLVAPLDTFPPSPPNNLNAVPDGGRVILLWSPPPEADVAGYHIYRTEEGEPAERLLQEGLSVRLSFRDETAGFGKTYDYKVTAVDTHGNEGAPAQARIAVP